MILIKANGNIDIPQLSPKEYKALIIVNKIALSINPACPFVSENIQEMETGFYQHEVNVNVVNLIKTIADCLEDK